MKPMRKVVLANDEVYHVFNRSIEQRPIFIDKREYNRAFLTLDFYHFANPSLKLSKALSLERGTRQLFFQKLGQEGKKLVELVGYCFMPSHFHFLVKQKLDEGITKFISNFTNSYTRYFNIRRERIGPIFQGVFKAVRIESDEQLLHVSRYIHLNPVTSFIIKEKLLDTYPWSSLPEYLGKQREEICDKEIVLAHFSSREKYRKFVRDQIDYAKKLEVIKHLVFE